MTSNTVGEANLDTRRVTKLGPVIGFSDSHDTYAWLGIPYAAPPVGELRWRSPRQAHPWQSELKALRFRDRCEQRVLGSIFGDKNYSGSEDCLYVNVWAPSASSTELASLPVMVWVHGGGNTFGGADAYNCARLAASQNLILVTFNYRLGLLGWLSHPALQVPGSAEEDRSGNYGTLDMIAALRWVQENISVFGGDPGRVTLFGCSAGGWNVRSLLVAPKAEGLFHGAIVQSNALYLISQDEAQNFVDDSSAGHPQSSGEMLLQLIIDDGLAVDRVSAKKALAAMSLEETGCYLRSKTLDQLEAATCAAGAKNRECYFFREPENLMKVGVGGASFSVPKLFMDGIVFPKSNFAELFASGNYNRVPVILGAAKDEDKTFLALDQRYVDYSSGKPEIRNVELYEVLAEYLAKLWKAAGVDGPAQQMSNFQQGSVFAYRFDWDNQSPRNGIDYKILNGADHGIDVKFLFGVDGLSGAEYPAAESMITDINRDEYQQLSRAMMSYWAEFAYTGKPGKGRRGDLPEWPAWNSSDLDVANILVMDAPAGGGIRACRLREEKPVVLDLLKNDPRLTDDDLRYQVYREIQNYFITRLTVDEYCTLEDGAVAEKHPLHPL